MTNRKRPRSHSYDVQAKKRKINLGGNDSSDEESPQPSYNNNNPFPFLKQPSGVKKKGSSIYFTTNFNKNSINQLIENLDDIASEIYETSRQFKIDIKNFHIDIHISSPGGDAFSCFRAIDWIKKSDIPIHTYVEGMAASAGALLACVGDKRYIGRYSYMLIHGIQSGGMMGNMHQIIDEFNNISELENRCRQILLDHTNLKENTSGYREVPSKTEVKKPIIEDVDEAISHDLYWDSRACLKAGLVDEIV